MGAQDPGAANRVTQAMGYSLPPRKSPQMPPADAGRILPCDRPRGASSILGPFEQFPWFREATVAQLSDIRCPRPGHLR
jgi:hypothetical protein